MSFFKKLHRKSSKKQELAALLELKSRMRTKDMSPGLQERNSFLLRFLKSVSMDPQKAVEKLERYLNYAQVHMDQVISMESSHELAVSFQCITGARDYQNRPVFQIPNIGRWNISEILRGQTHVAINFIRRVIWMCEKEILAGRADHGVLILDLGGVTYSQMLNKRAFEEAISFVHELEDICPNTMGKTIVLNAPKIIKVLANTAYSILRFSEEKRKENLFISSGDSDWKEQLLEYVAEDQLCPEFGGTFKPSLLA